MATALANSGRDILFSACSWGSENTHEWIKSTGSHTWRSTPDIADNRENLCNLVRMQKPLLPYNGLGCFNDMDMLVVGMNGVGHVGLTGCTETQYKTHFALWAFMGSNLMIGCDIRNMSPETKRILTCEGLIAINQDAAYRQPFSVGGSVESQNNDLDDSFVWAKLLEDGRFAIGFFNLSDSKRNMYLSLNDLALHRFCDRKLVLHDVWSGETSETVDGFFLCPTDAYDCHVFIADVVKA